MSKIIAIFAMLLLSLQPVFVFAEDDYKTVGEKGREEWKKGNLITAMDLLKKSADKGYAPAQSALAYILDKAEEDSEAFALYKKSAEQNYAEGQYGLASMYLKGEGVEKNELIGGQWMSKAAQQDYVPAMESLAWGYEAGRLGFKRNLKQASAWFHRCHERGDSDCSRRLARAYGTGDLGFPVNIPKSKELYAQINAKEKK